MTHRIRTQVLGLGTTVVALLALAAPSFAQSSEQAQLMARSREARTVSEHADLARQFRLQAESLDAKAAEREAVAARQARQAPSIVHKWPSMAPGSLNQVKQQAVEARRAAQESRSLAERHLRLAVEAQATSARTAD